MNRVNKLNVKNNQLKSKLLKKQLENGTYSFRYSKKEMLDVLNAYKVHKSIVKAASIVGIDPKLAMKWYSEGMSGDEVFRGFYLAINEINEGSNRVNDSTSDNVVCENKDFEGEFKISQYGDGWSYTTYVDGEKIFIISNELETLKDKVKSKRLPLE